MLSSRVSMCTWVLSLLAVTTAVFARQYAPAYYTTAGGDKMFYHLWFPENYQQGKEYPLLTWLHGRGGWSIPGGIFTRTTPPEYQCFILSPACPQTDWWWTWSAESPTKSARIALELIKSIRDGYPIEKNRLYITGHSMGGAGTWDFMWAEPDLFAAGVPMSGCLANYQQKAPAVVDIPVWFFWGALDTPGMQAGYPIDTIHALEALGGRPRYTEYPNLAHNTPNTVLSEPELFPWLFSQQTPEPASALALAAGAGMLLSRRGKVIRRLPRQSLARDGGLFCRGISPAAPD